MVTNRCITTIYSIIDRACGLKTMVCDNGHNLPALNIVLEWFHPQCSPERGQSFCPVSSWSLVSVEIYNVANSPSVIDTLYIQIHCEKFCFGKEKIYYIHRKWKWLYRQTVYVFIDHSIPTIPWTYPQFPLYSNFPWLSCMAKSGVWKLRATIWHPAFQKSCHSKEKFK